MTNGGRKPRTPAFLSHVDAGLWARDDRHDAYYVVSTNEWVEPKCYDPECEFCNTRPDKHIPKETLQ